ncbi:MAG TPA: NAD(P)H-binding protein [Flavisolibacter sp.]|jgi:uncharacterized protein YbjT (DUF2867 family)|nr:NAD(P)H-binding protein [Flavisolibacter sp.]
MKYVITGGAGNISKPLAEQLLAAGHQVVVIGRNAENLKPLTDKGAQAAIGSVEDVAFVKQAFAGADAVYTMVPPTFAASDWKAFIGQIGENYAEAIKANGIKKVVNLSSIGAHMKEGAGPVSGLFRSETALNNLENVDVLHLRPGYFYENLLANVGMVKGMNILGGNFGNAETKMVLTTPEDIAAVAAEVLLSLNFKGVSYRYIASDVRTTGDLASVLGEAVGKPGLPWVEFTDEQSEQGMIQAGLPGEVARNFMEMGAAIRSGKLYEEYWKHQENLGKVKLEDFAQKFRAVYSAS